MLLMSFAEGLDVTPGTPAPVEASRVLPPSVKSVDALKRSCVSAMADVQSCQVFPRLCHIMSG
jgi:hypothetical protein